MNEGLQATFEVIIVLAIIVGVGLLTIYGFGSLLDFLEKWQLSGGTKP